MQVITERLCIRPLMHDDIDWIHFLCIQTHVKKYLFDNRTVSRSWAEVAIANSQLSFTRERFGLWLLCRLTTLRPLGFCGFYYFSAIAEPQLIYVIHPSEQTQGYATEAAQAVVQYAFSTLRRDRLFANVHGQNLAARRVLEKLGAQIQQHPAASQPNPHLVQYSISHTD
ncbi:GNAT family N-acetyltransferase [Leptolyngbya sp. AN02str]|uniref:GNAT family N-acetyltransferase n=1 Tax=Leptolyngbya sp. AN02str TaxID=3423363 RepID=UPI003D32030C